MNALSIHIIFVAIAYLFYTVSVVCAVMVWLKHRSLKKGGRTARFLPALLPLERAQFIFLLAGTLELMLAFIFGGVAFYHSENWGLALQKMLLSAVTLIAACTLLYAHWRFGTRGRAAARFVVLIYAVFLLAYLMSRSFY